MRRGKTCAQAAHAALNLFYSAFNLNVDSLTATLPVADFSRLYGAWIERDMPIEVSWVNSEQELRSILDAANKMQYMTETVIDLGKTEFKGRKTMTVVAVIEKIRPETKVSFGPKSLYKSLKDLPRDHWLHSVANADEFVKQMIVIDAANKPQMDEQVASVCRAVIATCTSWLDVSSNKQSLVFKLVKQPELVCWLLNHTTKIVVGSKVYGQYLNQLAARYRAVAGTDALQWQQRSTPSVVAFPPLKASCVDPLTRELKLM